jgi:hypothetical protein
MDLLAKIFSLLFGSFWAVWVLVSLFRCDVLNGLEGHAEVVLNCRNTTNKDGGWVSDAVDNIMKGPIQQGY